MRSTAFIFLVVLLFSNHTALSQTEKRAEQEIRFKCEDAKEVYLVWGVNNWQIINELKTPETFVKNNLFYTPMNFQEGAFVAKLNLPQHITIDYDFWIAKGPGNYETDLWDANWPKKDYHTRVGDNPIVTVESKLKVRPKQNLSLLDFAQPLSINLFILMAFLLMFKKHIVRSKRKSGPYAYIIAAGIVLYLMLLGLRQSITGLSWEIYLHPLKHLGDFFISGYYDLIYVSVVTAIFLALVFAFRKSPRVQKGVLFSFFGICLISLVVGILNIRIVEALGRPFNLQWFYYSDFLHSKEAKSTVSSNLSSDYVFNISLLLGAAVFSVVILLMAAKILLDTDRSRKLALYSLGVCLSVYLAVSGWKINSQNLNYDTFSNPVVAFTESLRSFSQRPALFSMLVPDSLQFRVRKNKRNEIRLGNNKIRNVLVFVMESTPSEYIQSYGSKYNVTPELEKYSRNTILFENIYAHAPATNLSMVSLLGSMYPWLSCYTLTNEYPELNFPTISSELKKRGYRTAFYNSADNRFQKAGEFLSYRNLDKIVDCQGEFCTEKYIKVNENWQYPDGKDDECTADQLTDWIIQEKDKPFFAAMWTYQTHYPYFISGTKKQFETSDTMFNRYLNALHHSDYVFGKLMKRLEQENLLESTLVVVVGDHGEAFGRHDQITHAQKLYEENLHVPCLFINPSFNSVRNKTVGGLVDIAPTVLNFLGYDSPDKWQGESLLSGNKRRTYFFAPWSDYLFGYREENHKFIFNVTKNRMEVYDLEKDPQETNDLASRFEHKAEMYHQRMAAWVQYQNKFMEELIKSKIRN
jgi:phosphoglycerol transferase MdoB-like AlkP superfamily enzyme